VIAQVMGAGEAGFPVPVNVDMEPSLSPCSMTLDAGLLGSPAP
jgi:hypothetical protein